MSTSLLYHAFGLRTYDYMRTQYLNGATFFHVKKKDGARCCSNCKSRDVTLAGRVERVWRSVPIGLKPTIIVGYLHILTCKRCGVTRLETLDIADSRKSYTRSLARYVLDLAKDMTLKAVAEKARIGWDTIKVILKEDLQRRLKKRNLNKVRFIAIDEVSIGKRHRYLTNIVDLETGNVIYSAEGKDTECLKPFFAKVKRSERQDLRPLLWT